MGAVQSHLPGLDGALVPGPVFFTLRLGGTPRHKARHRSRIVFPKAGKPFVHQYPDPETEAFEKTLAQAASLTMGRRAPSIRPLCVLVIAGREIPKSWSAKDRQAALDGRILPTPKPDADNHFKIVDALNGIVWKDDAQAVDIRTIKKYAAAPYLAIQVWEFIEP
jgi:Holliday junction resolvase RusA-like endonuclease